MDSMVWRALSDVGIAVTAGGVLVLLFIQGFRSRIKQNTELVDATEEQNQRMLSIMERQNEKLLDRILRGDGNGGAGLGQVQVAVQELDERVATMSALLKTRPCVLEQPCPPEAMEERLRTVAGGR